MAAPKKKPVAARSRLPLVSKGAAKVKAKAAVKKSGGSKKKSGKIQPAAGPWSWKTPDEDAKLRMALGVIALVLALVAWWSGEIRHSEGTWRAGFRSLRGDLVLGLEWRRGEWPRRWSR